MRTYNFIVSIDMKMKVLFFKSTKISFKFENFKFSNTITKHFNVFKFVLKVALADSD